MAVDKDAEVRLKANNKDLAKGLKDAEKKWSRFKQGLTKGARAGFGKAFGGTLGGLKTAVGMTGFAGMTALIGNEAVKTFEFEEALSRLAINSDGAVGGLDALRKQIFAISGATGVAREEVLAGAREFITLTGDAKTATSSMDLFARVSKATGATMEDIAKSSAAMSQNLKIEPGDFERAFSILIQGGKRGSIELRDMAQLMSELAPQFAEFTGGSGITGLARLGSSLQVVRRGFATGQEAATGLASLMTAVVKNAGRFKEKGIQVFEKGADGKQQLRDFADIITDIGNSKLANNPTALQKAFGRQEAYRAFLQLRNNADAWEQITRETMGANDVAQDYAKFQSSEAGKLQKSWNDLKNTIAETFTPERIKAFVEGMGQILTMARDFIGLMSDFFDKWEEMRGGAATAETRGAQEDMLARISKATGLSDEQIARMEPMHLARRVATSGDEGLKSDFEFTGRGGSAFGAIEAAKRQVGGRVNRLKDARRVTRSITDNLSREMQRISDQAEAQALEQMPQPFTAPGLGGGGLSRPGGLEVVITMDPSTTDLQGKLANSPHHRVSP